MPLRSIFNQTQKVLKTAIDKKVDHSNFPKSYLLPHRQPGESCPICSGKIKKETISGRSGYFCSQHQKLIN